MAFIEKAGRYKIGPPERPDIKHDNGFLDKFPRRKPTAEDYVRLAAWRAAAEGYDALCGGPRGKKIETCKSEDQSDSIAAYYHFLYGEGKPRYFDYERYLVGDPSGEKVLPAIIEDFQVEIKRLSLNRQKFSVTSTEYSIGGNHKVAPYPQHVNWQRTLGAHSIWVSADVCVTATAEGHLKFSADLLIHVEDMYNFNPDKKDESTNIPDAENGRFEITGLAHQYLNYSEIRRHVEWNERPFGNTKITKVG
jgi:hypothetical protein